MSAGFPWPSPRAGAEVRWTGDGFLVGGERVPYLAFPVGEPGWSDDLTTLHEETNGADHPLDVASRARALAALRRLRFGDRRGALLEVGCSSGYFLRAARAAYPGATILGADAVDRPLRALAAADPTLPLLRFDLTRAPLADACLDVVVALNVLEHIRDDAAAVREIHRMLRPGGAAVIELPAGPWLYDVHDRVLRHERRYSMKGARRLFEGAGFVIESANHAGFFVFPAFAAVKLANRHLSRLSLSSRSETAQRAAVERSNVRTRSSRLLRIAMAVEGWGGERVRYPFGIRCVFMAVRPLEQPPPRAGSLREIR